MPVVVLRHEDVGVHIKVIEKKGKPRYEWYKENKADLLTGFN